MSNPNTAPRAAQWAVGGALLTIAMGAGVTGLYINVTHGAAVSVTAAILFGLADIGRIASPFAASVIGWTRQIKLIAWVCTGVSVYCAVTAQIEAYGGHHAARAGQASAYAAAQADAARFRTELAAIGEAGTSSGLAEAAKLAARRAEAEEVNGGCRKRCLDARAESAALTERSGKAARREELERKLDTVSLAQASAGPVHVGWEGKGLVNGIIVLILIETLVWLSIPALRLLTSARKTRTRVAKAVLRPAQKQRQERTRWSASDSAALRTLWGQGMKAGAIAAQLGIAESAIRSKASRLGLKRSRAQLTGKPKLVANS